MDEKTKAKLQAKLDAPAPKKQAKYPPAYNFEENGDLFGKLIDVKPFTKKNGAAGVIYTVETESGNETVFGTVTLNRSIEESDIVIGDTIGIRLMGVNHSEKTGYDYPVFKAIKL